MNNKRRNRNWLYNMKNKEFKKKMRMNLIDN